MCGPMWRRAAVGGARAARTSVARLQARAVHTSGPARPVRCALVTPTRPLYLAEHGGAGRLLARPTGISPPAPLFSLSGGRVLSTAASTGSAPAEQEPEPEPTDMRVLRSLRMHPDQYVAKEGFNRAWLLPACVANHASLGAIFAWSVLNQPLLRNNGVVAPVITGQALATTS